MKLEFGRNEAKDTKRKGGKKRKKGVITVSLEPGWKQNKERKPSAPEPSSPRALTLTASLCQCYLEPHGLPSVILSKSPPPKKIEEFFFFFAFLSSVLSDRQILQGQIDRSAYEKFHFLC